MLRPEFMKFYNMLLDEIWWQDTIKANDSTGQADSDSESLKLLAEKVKEVGENQGYM